MKTRALIPLGLFLLLAGLFYFMLGKINQGEYNPRDIPTEFIGRPAPSFSLRDLLAPETQVSPASYQGKPWLFNVWGTWCPECWREHEYLGELARQGIVIVGLNWRDQEVDARQMLARMGNPFVAIAFDPDSQVAIDWGVYGAPETFLIDADGIIREKHKGALTPAVWAKKFQPYFAKGKEDAS
jgi:cytochrome c biogenesis protein CcmG/thiol:disulfide interchange protein DsbE